MGRYTSWEHREHGAVFGFGDIAASFVPTECVLCAGGGGGGGLAQGAGGGGCSCSTGIRWGVSPAAQMGCLRNMRREERVTVQGPVKEQQPDGTPHRGAGVCEASSERPIRWGKGAQTRDPCH